MVCTSYLHIMTIFYRNDCIYNMALDAAKKVEERKNVVEILTKLPCGLNCLATPEVCFVLFNANILTSISDWGWCWRYIESDIYTL